MLKPGNVIGILGGGQLGRMMAMAAARLGLKAHIYAPEKDSPAFSVSANHTIGKYDDEKALIEFAKKVDVITYEFENIPVSTVNLLQKYKPVRPGVKALEYSQDRLIEKKFLNSLNIRTAKFAEIKDKNALADIISSFPLPAILKTTRLGYDGKGQKKIEIAEDIKAASEIFGNGEAILESLIPFIREVSVIASRGIDGNFETFDVTENEHRDHILRRSFVPAQILPKTARFAVAIAKKIGESLDYIGTFAVEFFVVIEDGEEHIIVNEIAPRVHNSGHWTMDGASVCQFEQHIRAIAGWPLARAFLKGRVEMQNLIGDEVNSWHDLLSDIGVHLHLYGKEVTSKGRKMGHFTRVIDLF